MCVAPPFTFQRTHKQTDNAQIEPLKGTFLKCVYHAGFISDWLNWHKHTSRERKHTQIHTPRTFLSSHTPTMLSHWHTHTRTDTQLGSSWSNWIDSTCAHQPAGEGHHVLNDSWRPLPPLSLSLSFSLNGYLTIDLSIHPSIRPVHLIQLHVQSVRLVRTGGPGVFAPPPPHTSSMSGMPAMLRCVSTFIPRLVKKKKNIAASLLGPVWDIMLLFGLRNKLWP